MSQPMPLRTKDAREDTRRRLDSRLLILLLLIVLLGAALRLYDLGAESYWIDEMSTVIEGQQTVGQLLGSGRMDQPLAFYLPYRLWLEAFSSGEAGARGFAAVAGTASIVLIYFVGLKLFGKEVGILSSFFMAIAEFQIFHSQAARFYTFFEFTVLLSYLFFILSLNSRKRAYFGLYVVVSIVMMYSHAYGLFILAAQNLYVVLKVRTYRSQILSWVTCQVLIMLAIIPYFYPLLTAPGGVSGSIDFNIGGYAPPTFLSPLRSLYRQLFSPRRETSWEVISFIYILAALMLIVGTWLSFSRRNGHKFSLVRTSTIYELRQVPEIANKVLLVTCWLLCPILLPFFLSMFAGPMYADHYTISAAPALYLLLSLGMFSIRRFVPLAASLGALLIVIVPGLVNYYVADVHEQWGEAAAYVAKNSEQGDVIVLAPNQGIGIQERTFDWYYRGTLPRCEVRSAQLADAEIYRSLEKCITGRKRAWIIMRGRDDTVNRFKSLFQDSAKTHMSLVHRLEFVGISLYLLELGR